MLTKGSFTRDEWHHLLRLLNIMSFWMFFCTHFSYFLCDPTRKQSAMSKRGQEATSSEGSPMAKPKPMIPAKATPLIWCRAPRWVRGKILRRIWEIRSIRECRWRTRWSDKPLETVADKPKPRCNRIFLCEATGKHSTFRLLETRRRGGIFELDKYKETCAGGEHKDRVSEHEVHKPSIHDDFFCKRSCELQQVTQHLQLKHSRPMYWYGECSCLRQWKQPFILDQMIWQTWKYTRARASRKFRVYSISHRNWHWRILKRFWMCIRLKAHLPRGRDRHWLMIKWSSGQRQKCVSTQTPYWSFQKRCNYRKVKWNIF